MSLGAHRKRAKSRHRWNHNGHGDRRFGGRPFEARQSPENSGGQQPYESGMKHALGYRRPLCGLSRSRERHRDAGSYSAGLREAQGKGNVVYIEGIKLDARRPGGWSRTTTASVIADILTSHPDIDAVTVSNDDSAIAIVSALEQRKMKALVSGRDAIKEVVALVAQAKRSIPTLTVPRVGKLYVERFLSDPVQSLRDLTSNKGPIVICPY